MSFHILYFFNSLSIINLMKEKVLRIDVIDNVILKNLMQNAKTQY